MVSVTINGKAITLNQPVTILDAARRAGVEIPTLCSHELLESYGGCRLCLVEIDKVPKLQTACTTPVSDGMVIWTESKAVVEARKAILEFLLIQHPLDCPVCDKAGECALQDASSIYLPSTVRFKGKRRRYTENLEDPLIVRNMERCIRCTRCVRMCDQVQGAFAIGVMNRSSMSLIEPFSNGRFDCEYCGNCLFACPVGALTSRVHRHAFRSWMTDKEVVTVCPFCGVGCSLTIQARQNTVLRAISAPNEGFNRGILCHKGRFGYDYVSDPERLRSPLVRKNGKLQPVSLEEAIRYAGERLRAVKEQFGGSSIGGLISGRCCNEEAYVFQKFFRGALGSNNIDSTSGLAYTYAFRFIESVFGSGSLANRLSGISSSDGVLVIGGDPTSVSPVLGLEVRAAFRKGKHVIAIGDAQGLRAFRSAQVMVAPQAETVLLRSLICALRGTRTPVGDAKHLKETIARMTGPSLENTAGICGIPPERLNRISEILGSSGNLSIIIGTDIIRRKEGHLNLLLIACLAYLLSGKIWLMPDLPNEYGLLQMGCSPDLLPGGRNVSDNASKNHYENLSGFDIPREPGLTIMEMIEGSASGSMKALYVMGGNPMFYLPDAAYVRTALSRLDLLIVHDAFLTETGRLAHVVLPSLAWPEKRGTYTNLDGRTQLLCKALEGDHKEDREVLSGISGILDFDLHVPGDEGVSAEISLLLIPEEQRYPESGYLGMEEFAHLLTGPFSFHGDSGGGRIFVGIGNPLLGLGNLERRSLSLRSIAPEPKIRMSRKRADLLGLSEGSTVAFSTAAGSDEFKVVIDPDIPDDLVIIPQIGDGGTIMGLMDWKVNPVTKSPALDETHLAIRKIIRL